MTADSMYPRPDTGLLFTVTDARWDSAMAVYNKALKTLTTEKLFEIIAELGFWRAVEIKAGLLEQFKVAGLTDIQFVAIAYALGAVMENNLQQEPVTE